MATTHGTFGGARRPIGGLAPHAPENATPTDAEDGVEPATLPGQRSIGVPLAVKALADFQLSECRTVGEGQDEAAV